MCRSCYITRLSFNLLLVLCSPLHLHSLSAKLAHRSEGPSQVSSPTTLNVISGLFLALTDAYSASKCNNYIQRGVNLETDASR